MGLADNEHASVWYCVASKAMLNLDFMWLVTSSSFFGGENSKIMDLCLE